VKELRRAVLVADEQVQEPVVVDVGPDRRLRPGRRLRQAARHGDVGERPVAVVAQQRLPLRRFPAATQHQDVEMAVVVVVGLDDVQPAKLRGQPRLRRPIVNVPSSFRWNSRSGAQLSMLEVTMSSRPSRSKSSTMTPPDIDTDCNPARGATSTKRPTSSLDSNAPGGISCARGTLVWIGAGKHVREVEQPPHFELVGLHGKVGGEVLDGLGHVGNVGQPRPGLAGSRQRSPGRAYTPLSISALCR
jgi:hypothetical protein